MVGIRQLAMALLATRWGPKEQVHNAYSPFYRFWDSLVTSLRVPYDVTGDVPNASLTAPQQRRQVGKPQAGEWSVTKMGGATVTKTRGLSNCTGAKRLGTGTP